MAIFLCIICFYIYDKMQGFTDESGLFIYLFFCILRRNSRWPPKLAGKRFLRKLASRLCRYPAAQKFRQNRSISLRFRNKRIFVFNTEIQDGRQKGQENVFFCEIMPIDSADTLRVKKFVKIALPHSISEINTFLHFTQKFKMVTKSGGKTIFEKNRQ